MARRKAPVPKKKAVTKKAQSKKTQSKKTKPKKTKAKSKTVKAVKKRAVKEDPEEIARLFDLLQAEEKSEKAWEEMVSPDQEDGEDWHKKEQSLQKKPDRRRRKETSWKYFGK
ncbi:hypothetical protein ACFL2T_02010 [Elusimicrobiota bacterium]